MTGDGRRKRLTALDIRELLAAARQGSADAVAGLVHLFRPYLMHIAEARMRPWLKQKEGASDAVQQTVVEAQRDFAACGAADAVGLRLWLRGILLHNLEDVRKKYVATAKREVDRERRLDGRESRDLLLQAAVARSDPPSRAMSAAEQRELVQRALSALRPEYREAIELHHFDGFTFDQIGAMIHKTRQAAERLVKRAEKKFGGEYRRMTNERGGL